MNNFDLKKYLAEGRLLREDISQEIQALIDKNDFLKGKVTATSSDIVEGDKFVLLFSEDSAKHIAERHSDGNKPGSLFKSGVNLRDVAKKILNTSPSEQTGGRVKWLGVNGGEVGEMGVAKASPEEVAKMKDYTMPDGGKEQVKIAPGERKPTSEVSLITAELGTLENGKKALSMITMFPGGMKVDGVEIPMDRGQFASKGLYFIVDPSSPLLKESLNEVLDDLKDAQTAAEFIYTQLDTYIDNNLDGYGSGYMVEGQLEKLLKLVSKKFNIPENSFKIDDKYSTDYNEYDEGTTKGEIKLNNQSILTYSSHADGYGFGGDIDKNALKTELEKLIKPINESIYIKKLINEALKKYRKQLNEGLNISNGNYELPDFEEKKAALNQMFPYGDIDTDHYQYFGYDSEKELRDAIGFGEVDSSRITNAIQNATETIFPEEEGFKVDAILYYGDKKGNVSIVKGDDTLGFDINISL